MDDTGRELSLQEIDTTEGYVVTCGQAIVPQIGRAEVNGAQTGALNAENAGLRALIDVWPRLPLDTVEQILKLAGLE